MLAPATRGFQPLSGFVSYTTPPDEFRNTPDPGHSGSFIRPEMSDCNFAETGKSGLGGYGLKTPYCGRPERNPSMTVPAEH